MTRFCIALLFVSLFNFSSATAQGNAVIDSLLLELASIENKNDVEHLGQKAALCNEIADWYNKLYSDQDHTRLYLLQSISFLEEKIKKSPVPSASDQLILADTYRKVSLFEAFKGNLAVSEQYIAKCESLLLRLKNQLSKSDYDKAIFDFYHSCFALNLNLGNFTKAIEYLERATVIMEGNEELSEYKINILSEKSICYSNMGMHEKAMKNSKEALDLYYLNPPIDQPEDRFIYFYLKTLFLAGKYQEINEFVAADSNYVDVDQMERYLIANKDLASRSFFELIFLMGNTNQALYESTQKGDYLATAYQWYLDGFILAEKLTLSNQGEKIGNSLLRPKDKIVQLLQLFSIGIDEGTLSKENVVELIRILDVYQSSRLHVERLAHETNAENWGREKELKNESMRINLQIEELSKTGENKSVLDSLTARFNELMVEWIALKKKTKRDKVLSEYEIDIKTFNDQLRTFLKSENKTVLTYFYDEKDSALFILGHNPSTAFFRKVKAGDDVKLLIAEAFTLNSTLQTDLRILEEQDSLNRALFDHLIAPIQKQITTKNLLIYPLNEISYVSFDALLDTTNTYLVNHYTIQYTSSLFSLFSNKEVEISNPKFTAFYPTSYGTDTLPLLTHAKAEVEKIKTELSGTTYDGASASKKQFLELPTNHQILHIASHSNLNLNHPYESCILFDATEDSVDNRLYAFEIFSLDLENELVTLSSCNSGKGKLEEGIGVVSLANAFSFAGVPATVSSLWSAQDKSSAEIMINFYTNLEQGYSKSESLKAAKIEYLNQADKIRKQPFYWANYVVYGNDQPLFDEKIREKPGFYVLLIFGAAALVLGGAVYFSSRNKS